MNDGDVAAAAARALAERFTARNSPDGQMYVHFLAEDGYNSFRAATPNEAVQALIDAGVLPAPELDSDPRSGVEQLGSSAGS